MFKEIGTLHIAALLFAAVLVTPQKTLCQQAGDSSSAQDPGSNSSSPQTSSGSAGDAAPASAGTTQGLFAKALNSASALSGDNGPLQWGWLSVRSISFQEYFDSITLESTGMPSASESLDASQLSAAIVLSHAFGASHTTQLAVQYTPSLLISEGNVYPNTLNQTAGIDTTFQLSPRLGLQISDRFTYYGDQRDFSGLSLNVDYSLGTLATNSFLNGPGKVIYNSASAGVSYLWSPTTTVSVTPMFGYENASGVNDSQENLSALSGGAQVVVSHYLSASQTVGASYLGQYVDYTNNTTAGGPQSSSDGVLQDFLLTYGKQIGATWRFSVGFGLTNNTGADAQTGFGASAGISKSFRRMDFGVSYDRGHQFNGYITSASSDRIDVVNTIRVSRRLTTNSSAAYFRTVGGGPSTSGFYATGQVRFGLTPSLGLTAGYAYTRQIGDGVYVVNGDTRLATIGITWSPAVPAKY
jgi:hypothetical protein